MVGLVGERQRCTPKLK